MRIKLRYQMVLAVLLTAGIACLWGLLVGWGIAIYEAKTQPYQVFETVAVDDTGEVFVQIRDASGSYGTSTFRTLEGELLSLGKEHSWTSPATLNSPQAKRYESISRSWRLRVQLVARTSGADAATWYIVHDGNNQEGKAYLVGYSHLNNMPLGYFSQSGFSKELPPQDQWFGIDGRTVGYNRGAYVVSGGIYTMMPNGAAVFSQPYQQNSDNKLIITLATSTGLFEIDLKSRTFVIKDDRSAYLSVAECRVPLPVTPVTTAPNYLTDQATEVDSQELEKEIEKLRLYCIVARQAEKIVVFPAVDQEQFKPVNKRIEFQIPAELRERDFSFYMVSPGKAILDVPRGIMHGHTSDLYWINPQGKILISTSVLLNEERMQNQQTPFAIMDLILPVPIAVLVIVSLILPFQHPYNIVALPESTYFDRLTQILVDGWPAIVILVAIAALLAWWAVSRQRKNHLAHSREWGLFVFAFGLPAFVVYWILNPRPVTEKCSGCDTFVPRTQGICSSCQQHFPEPRMLGTEIFA